MNPLHARTTAIVDREPMISVIVHCYQQVSMVERCVRSVLDQELPEHVQVEVLLCDDGSSDGTGSVLEGFAQRHPGFVTLIRNKERKQFPAPCTPGRWMLLHAISQARGRYIALVDGDDHWTDPRKLNLQFEVMELEPAALICGHNGWDVHPDGRQVDYVRARHGSDVLPLYFTQEHLLLSCLFPKAALFFRRAALPVEMAPLRDAPSFDWTLLVLLSASAQVPCIDRHMAVRTIHAGNLISGQDVLKKLDWDIRMLRYLDALTAERHHAVFSKRLSAHWSNGLAIAIQRGSRPDAVRYVRQMDAAGAWPNWRARSRAYVWIRFPRLSAWYHRIRSGSTAPATT